MYNTFFIGDAFMISKSAMEQRDYSFAGAKKLENGSWEISIIITIVNGYAGGCSTVLWEAKPGDKLRVSGKMKGYFIIDGFNKQKTKQRFIREVVFGEIEKDTIELEFAE